MDDDGEEAVFDLRKVDRFKGAGKEFFKENYGSAGHYLRSDFDEQSFHFHGLLWDWVEEPESGRYARGRHILSLRENPLIAGDGSGKTGYELSQDAIAEFFARPEYEDMKIVRGEARAAKRREAKEQVKELEQVIGTEALFGECEDIPQGSPNARAMWLLKKKMSEAIVEKGGAEKVRKDQASNMALDHLELLGVLKPEERKEASTRRARTQLLKRYEEAYGTPAEIISKPDAVAEKVMKEAAAKNRAADEQLARTRKAEQERAAAVELEASRLQIWEEDLEHGQAVADEREAELEEREENLNEREEDLTRREKAIRKATDLLNTLGTKIIKTAKRLGLMKDLEIAEGVAAAEKLKKVKKPKKFEGTKR